MIVSKTPYRISFFGGATDFPQWYRKHGGAVLSTSSENLLDFTQISNGGGDGVPCCGFGSGRGNLIIGDNVGAAGTITVSESTIADSAALGVYVFPNGQYNESGVVYVNNALGDVGP